MSNEKQESNPLTVEQIEKIISSKLDITWAPGSTIKGLTKAAQAIHAAMPPDQSARISNLCDGCELWPCGNHSPIGVPGCVTETCANRKPTAGARIAELKANQKALAKSLEEATKDFMSANGMKPEWWNRVMPIVARIKAGQS